MGLWQVYRVQIPSIHPSIPPPSQREHFGRLKVARVVKGVGFLPRSGKPFGENFGEKYLKKRKINMATHTLGQANIKEEKSRMCM